tara:strand:- start:85 stop:294 length:210 start_codon:yes stop_codon:yes gene_type:complete
MSNLTCNKCQSTNQSLIKNEYQGDWSLNVYKCLDCGHKTTNYYDAIYFTQEFFRSKDEAKEPTQKVYLS